MRTSKKKITLDNNINKRMKNNYNKNNGEEVDIDMDIDIENDNNNNNRNSNHNGNDDIIMDDESYDFKFSQCFGDKTDIVVTEADIITAVEFNHTGEYLATGDKGGRVVLFQRNHNVNPSSSSSSSNHASTMTTASKNIDHNSSNNCEYKFLTEFQSHDAEFDYLKSLEIEEKINQIKWLKPIQKSHFLLSTNDKTIKLWKIYEKNIKLVSQNNNINNSNNHSTTNHGSKHAQSVILPLENLKLPKLSKHDTIIAATPKKIYSNAHTYHINSISANSDQETFLSADDLRINLWNLNIPNQSFNIVDIKPTNMEELTEVITCAEFHPINCNYFMYSSSKGTVKLCDMRINSLCDNFSSTSSTSNTKIFEEYIDPINHNFFTEITSSISDIKFSPNGRYIVSRDYLTVKIWDINMNNKPLASINVHDQLKERLSDTYENDAIFDKFEVNFNGKSNSIITGTYNSQFMIYPNVLNASSHHEKHNNNNNTNNSNSTPSKIVLQADKTAFRNKSYHNRSSYNNVVKEWGDDIDFKKSILHFSWHPRENSIAVAATNNLFIFSAL